MWHLEIEAKHNIHNCFFHNCIYNTINTGVFMPSEQVWFFQMTRFLFWVSLQDTEKPRALSLMLFMAGFSKTLWGRSVFSWLQLCHWMSPHPTVWKLTILFSFFLCFLLYETSLNCQWHFFEEPEDDHSYIFRTFKTQKYRNMGLIYADKWKKSGKKKH